MVREIAMKNGRTPLPETSAMMAKTIPPTEKKS
jgi:hypothetical protein